MKRMKVNAYIPKGCKRNDVIMPKLTETCNVSPTRNSRSSLYQRLITKKSPKPNPDMSFVYSRYYLHHKFHTLDLHKDPI